IIVLFYYQSIDQRVEWLFSGTLPPLAIATKMRSAPALQAKRHPLLLQNIGSPFTQRSQKPSLRNGHPENLKAEIYLRAYLCF
ncbi:hypothetical protein, partial [Escherichia coli]|uniref:hypothetical protein n=4 Tax=Escherichia coli TaxID=562 RepID=UPI001BDB7103